MGVFLKAVAALLAGTALTIVVLIILFDFRVSFRIVRFEDDEDDEADREGRIRDDDGG